MSNIAVGRKHILTPAISEAMLIVLGSDVVFISEFFSH
jgi:hypothetical protein